MGEITSSFSVNEMRLILRNALFGAVIFVVLYITISYVSFHYYFSRRFHILPEARILGREKEVISIDDEISIKSIPDETSFLVKTVFGRVVDVIKYKDILLPNPETYVSQVKETKFTGVDLDTLKVVEQIVRYNIGDCQYEFNTSTNQINGIIRTGSLIFTHGKMALYPGATKVRIGDRDYQFAVTSLMKLHEFFALFSDLNDIVYIHSGGSLLGYCRDRLYLTWDDDIDLVIQNVAYKKLGRLHEYFSRDPKNFFHDGIRDSYSEEGFPVSGPLLLQFGDVRMMSMFYPETDYMKLIVYMENGKNIRVNDYASPFDETKTGKIVYVYGPHLDLRPCNWNETEKHCCFERDISPGPAPTDTWDDLIRDEFCGVESFFPKDCDTYLDAYFRRNWRMKVRQGVRWW